MSKQEHLLKLFLRIIGTVALFAAVAVVMPYSWMNATHQWLGMGQLPSEPVVGYLARSSSAFYALFGGLLWLTSCDLRRHRLVLLYLAAAMIIFGAALFVVDLLEGMPLYWSLTEGPINVAFGIVILLLSYRMGVERAS
ncbi:MAG: hypothetical protein ACYSUP_11940 [Planctomycetota bacterium]|jgi:hypothetical protein